MIYILRLATVALKSRDVGLGEGVDASGGVGQETNLWVQELQ